MTNRKYVNETLKIDLIDLVNEVKNKKSRSKWSKAVMYYAIDMIHNEIEERQNQGSDYSLTRLQIANMQHYPIYLDNKTNYYIVENKAIFSLYDAVFRASKEASYGGFHLIYNGDLAENLLTPSEIKRRTRKDGSIRSDDLLDIQARAVYQAVIMMLSFAY